MVRRWDSDLDTDLTPDLVTERLLQLSGVLADHLRTPAELADATDELARMIADAAPAVAATQPFTPSSSICTPG